MISDQCRQFPRGLARPAGSGGAAIDAAMLLWYRYTMITIDRVQTGVRLERRLLKVLKALAEYLDLSLGDLIEGIVLHAFEAKVPFSETTLRQIEALKSVYGLDLTAADAHRLVEGAAGDDAP
jgi:hypothetical protein